MFLRRVVVCLIFLGYLVGANAKFADSVEECPALKPRQAPPTNVRDLRPDDIRMIGALGDSVMAGFGAKGIQGYSLISLSSIYESRGLSFGGGDEPGVCTIPNLIKRYSPLVLGSSRGEHMVEYCGDRPKIDHLNAAQSGAIADNLDHELNYLLPGIETLCPFLLLTYIYQP
ncbi:hypothetical protein EC973_002451 [Apophysomyces ossiformis]|uniref:Uncharacterized protein n=1 Tax=Apophysomyces ossiformis TaxID=679940 RepID=A0A8H7BMV3_9FUNG|nr:hypothetical protein EC973_002451 [Apophysomyces ossiformis]